jgi:hypothetical protein
MGLFATTSGGAGPTDKMEETVTVPTAKDKVSTPFWQFYGPYSPAVYEGVYGDPKFQQLDPKAQKEAFSKWADTFGATRAEMLFPDAAGGGPSGPALPRPAGQAPTGSRGLDALISALNETPLDSLKDMKEGVKETKALTGLVAGQSPNLDLTPLMKLADTWYGGKLSEGYTQGGGPEKQRQQLMALKNAVDKGRVQVTNQEMGLLRSMIEGERVAALARAARAKAQAGPDRKELLGATQAMQKSDAWKEANNLVNTKNAVNKYMGVLQEGGLTAKPGTKRYMDLKRAHTHLVSTLKENPYKLGALTGPDLQLMYDVVPDPTAMKNVVFSDGRTLAQVLSGVSNEVDTRFQNASKEIKSSYVSLYPELAGQYKSLGEKFYLGQSDGQNSKKLSASQQEINALEQELQNRKSK